MSHALRVNYIPLGETTVRLSLRCERCLQHICYVQPGEAAAMAARLPRTVPVYCFRCETELAMTENIILKAMEDYEALSLGVKDASIK